MDEKKQILEALVPVAVLRPMTPEAKRAVPQTMLVDGLVGIRRLPFKIGRESRVKKINGKLERIERTKLDDREPSNDLYLVDEGHLLNISREHLQIERKGNEFFLVDRGSACGTRVGNVAVGGDDAGGRVPLQDGDVIAIGVKATPYCYRFITLDEFHIRRRE